MTFDLKWLLPFTVPFFITGIYRLLALVTGVAYSPDFAILVSTIFGLLLGGAVAVLLFETPAIWPVRISKKGGDK